MARLLVGDSDCTLQELALIFDESSISTLKITWWTSLAVRLDIPLASVKIWQKDVLLNKLTYIDVILEMLTQWRMRKSRDATLGALYDAIPSDQKQLKDYLQAKIRKKAKCWDDLDADSQNVILETNVKFLGQYYSLLSLRKMITEEKFKKILNETYMADFFQKSFNKEDWDLGQYPIPKPLPYYIPRKVTRKRKLNPAIFKHKCSDIFVFEGIQHHHLSILVRPELTDTSSEQVRKQTRRFILLEHPDDFNEITKIAKNNVHRIKHEDDQFYWLSTTGSCQMIRVFLINEVEEISETSFIKAHLSTFNNRPIAICSSPGMGKSVLLANMAQHMVKTYVDRLVLHLELSSLIPKLSSFGPELEIENVKQILASSSSKYIIGKDILFEVLHNKNLVFEIFLDGFDEISSEFFQLANQFLKCLHGCPNIRIHITARPHMQNEIENKLEIISLDIAPFNQTDQLSFFCDFWALNQNITTPQKLSEFALKVLESLKFINENLTSDNEFAGIPLQCFMLAQIYSIYAKMYCNRDHFNFQLTNSLYDLFAEFMNFKFRNIKECDRHLIKMYHWKEALLLLFADNQQANKIVQDLNSKLGTEEVPWEKVFAVGLLEYAPKNPSFVHRTFAEYLVAEFILEELLINETIDEGLSVKFIIDSVFLVNETIKGHVFSLGEMKEMSNLIELSECWLAGKLDAKKLKVVLLSECDVALEAIEMDLSYILYIWVTQLRSYATIDKFDGALDLLGCNKLKDELHNFFFKKHMFLHHELVCTFLEAALDKDDKDKKLSNRKFRNCQYKNIGLTRDREHYIWKLFMLTKHGFHFLTKALVQFYRDTSLFDNVLNMDSNMCKDFLILASYNDNVEFFEYISDTLKPLITFNFKDFLKVYKFPLFVMHKSTPLFEAMRNGNYKLVACLFNYIGDDLNKINDLWLACFYENCKDSARVVQNKVKIFRWLKSLNQNFQVEKLEHHFPTGVNVALLTTVFDVFDYVPCEKNLDFIDICLTHFCRDTDFDILVKYFLSKNLAHLLTHMYSTKYCLLNSALVGNLMKPETLAMVYKEHNFDLGIILETAVLCKRNEIIVKTILELSCDVNCVDSCQHTLLHWAAFYRRLNLMKYLSSIGADVNFKNSLGNTPLHKIIQNSYQPVSFHLVHDAVNLLVIYDADVGAKNIAGLTAFQLAKAHQTAMSIEERTLTLLQSPAPYTTTVWSRILEKFKTLKQEFDMNSEAYLNAYRCDCFFPWVWNIVQISGSANMSNSQNITLLHRAAIFGDLKAMEYLLLNGADVNSKDNDGNTPLHYIFDWNWRNNFKNSPFLDKYSSWNHAGVQLLLKYNVDVRVKNYKQQTPLDCALQQKDNLGIEDCTIQLLIEKLEKQFLSSDMNTVDSVADPRHLISDTAETSS